MALHLRTARLQLRPWHPDDAAEYRSLVTERGVPAPSLQDVRARMERQHEQARTRGIALLAVTRQVEADLIGYCGLTVGRATVAEPELAFELFRRVHNNGYATEAAEAVLGAAAQTGRGRLWATVRTWNAASLRVLDKLGFTRDRVTADDEGELVWLTRALPAKNRS
jgi:RimJ/RimL family protein N-acetyltransferase